MNPFPERTREEHNEAFEERLATLNAAQKRSIDALEANFRNTDPRQPKCLFIEGPGGTGKTYLIEVRNLSKCQKRS